MKVGLDVAPLVQTRAGTARWVNGLCGALAARADVEVTPLAWGGSGRLTAVARDVAWYPFLLPRAAARAGVDVLHCTIFRAPSRARVPTILTVHDLAVLRHPEVFPLWTRLYGRTLLRRTIRAADRVIAVSEFSKRETVELAGVDPGRIDVVPNGVEPVFAAQGPAADGDYVLAVGTVEPRKNLARVIEAAALAGLELRVVGDPGWGGVEVTGAHVTRLGFVPDEELARLYRGARCLVFPSLYEGFGIPAAGGDGLRHACRDLSRAARWRTSSARRRVLVDPLDASSIAAGIDEAGGGARSSSAGPRAGTAVHVGAGRRGRGGLVRAGGRVSPLVVVDADTLGRRRTGDERYVSNLLRELAAPAADAGLRLAAVTRHPELVPPGIEPLPLSTPVQELRMLWALPRLLRRRGAALVHTQYALPARSPAPAVVTIHDLSFEREPELMSRKDRAVFRRVVPHAARNARRVLTVSERTKRDLRRALRAAAGQGRGDAERRRSCLHAKQQCVARSIRARGRCGAAAEEPVGRGRGCDRSRAPARRRRADQGRVGRGRAALHGEPTCAATSPRTSSSSCTGAPRASSSPRGTRGSACLCWRRWRAARPSSPSTSRRCARWPATQH